MLQPWTQHKSQLSYRIKQFQLQISDAILKCRGCLTVYKQRIVLKRRWIFMFSICLEHLHTLKQVLFCKLKHEFLTHLPLRSVLSDLLPAFPLFFLHNIKHRTWLKTESKTSVSIKRQNTVHILHSLLIKNLEFQNKYRCINQYKRIHLNMLGEGRSICILNLVVSTPQCWREILMLWCTRQHTSYSKKLYATCPEIKKLFQKM